VTLARLRQLLVDLGRMRGLERTREARRLSDVALTELAAAGDEGVYEATRTATYAEVAEELGVSLPAIGKAIVRHNKALTVRTESDRPKRAARKKRA
jgi:predicted DNA binding protein